MKNKNIFKSSVSGILPNLIGFPIRFFYLKLFIEKFGSETNGLIQLFSQLLAYLVLIEGGLGGVLMHALYSPLYKNDKKSLISIISQAQRLYNYIGYLILVLGIFLVPSLKFFLNSENRNKFSLNYLSILFIIYILTSIIPYFANAKKFLLVADQKNYVVNWIEKGANLLDIVIGLGMLYIDVSLETILIKSLILKFIQNIFIQRYIKKKYLWLKLTKENINPNLFKNMKYTFIGTLAGVIVFNTDYIIISKFLDLNTVTIYSNYIMLTGVISLFINPLFQGIKAVVGEVVAKKNLKEMREWYWKYLILTFFISSTFVTIVYFTIDNFIILWLGREYLIDKLSLIFILFNVGHGITRYATGDFITSAGEFKAGVILSIGEVVINLGVSLYLVTKFGVLGVILGTALSHLICTFWYLQKYCLNNLLKQSFVNYIKKWILYFIYLSTLILGVKYSGITGILTTDKGILLYVVSASIFSWIILSINYVVYLTIKEFRDMNGKLYKVIVQK